MKVYKTDKIYLILLSLILIASLLLAYSYLLSEKNNIKSIILSILLLTIVIILCTLIFRKIEVEEATITVRSIIRKKKYNIRDFDNAHIMYLQGRIVVLFSGNRNILLISSLYENFLVLISSINQFMIKDETEENELEKLNKGLLNRKKVTLMLFLIMLVVILVSLSLYNMGKTFVW